MRSMKVNKTDLVFCLKTSETFFKDVDFLFGRGFYSVESFSVPMGCFGTSEDGAKEENERQGRR